MSPLTRGRGAPRGRRRWLFVALGLTLAAELLGVQFLLHTTGGTLFVFSTLAPALVAAAVLILAGVFWHEFRARHRLFDVERRAAGTVICRQGQTGECAYFIRSGEVEVVREADGQSAVIARLGPGQYFGEAALLQNAPRNATVRAVTDVELAVLGKENFLNLIRLLPATHEDVLQTVQRRAMEAPASGAGGS
jgi:hypothetical protein